MQYIWNETLPDDPSLWLDYEATEAALQINQERIQERMPLKARFTPHLSKSGQNKGVFTYEGCEEYKR